MLDTSKIYESNNYGNFKVVNYVNAFNVEVEFVDTGYKTTAQSGQIILGNVKDKLKPSVYGVGFIGDGKYLAKVKGSPAKSYMVWASMLQRCYDSKYQASQPTYIGCTVSETWHNYQSFASWFEFNYVEGFHLDKDIISKGNKTYSPELCKFVSQATNTIEAHAKHHKFVSPDGDVVSIYNLRKFCISNGLDQGNMTNVHLGKVEHHKQWRKA